VRAVRGIGEWVGGVQVGGDDQGGVGVGARAPARLDRVQHGRERAHLGQRRLGRAGRIGEPEVLLEGVVPVGSWPGRSKSVLFQAIQPIAPASRLLCRTCR
jgi:hypothetical protein